MVFGPQKGATEQMIADMDKWLQKYALLAKKVNQKADSQYPGTGAAGGLGFAFLTFTNAVLQSGIDIVLKETKLEEKIKTADVVITGEGRLDEQTAMGKAPISVSEFAFKMPSAMASPPSKEDKLPLKESMAITTFIISSYPSI